MQPYGVVVKLHENLAKYNLRANENEEKKVDRILAMYNGSIINPGDDGQYTRREAAKLSLNTLMCTSESIRDNGGAGKHYGVGFQDLEIAAELGVCLMERCGIEDGRKILKSFIKIHYQQGIPLTRDNVTKTLTLFDLLENGPPVSRDHYLHEGGMDK